MQRWVDNGYLPPEIGTLSRRFVKAIAVLRGAVPPCVLAAVIRTLCNGWCTKRRFQQRAMNTCCLNRDCPGEDSIEHYCSCSMVHNFAWEKLRLRVCSRSLKHFLLLATLDKVTLVKQALLLYATYSISNQGRNSGRSSPNTCQDSMWERVRFACMLNSECAEVVAHIWQ